MQLVFLTGYAKADTKPASFGVTEDLRVRFTRVLIGDGANNNKISHCNFQCM